MAGEATAEDIDTWHRHGQRSLAISFANEPDRLLRLPPPRLSVFSLVAVGIHESAAFGVGHKGAHIGEAGNSGPVSSEDPSAELVLLAEPHSSHTGPLEPKVEPADS